jgi:hypothetical protein
MNTFNSFQILAFLILQVLGLVNSTRLKPLIKERENSNPKNKNSPKKLILDEFFNLLFVVSLQGFCPQTIPNQ